MALLPISGGRCFLLCGGEKDLVESEFSEEWGKVFLDLERVTCVQSGRGIIARDALRR